MKKIINCTKSSQLEFIEYLTRILNISEEFFTELFIIFLTIPYDMGLDSSEARS